MEKNGLCVIVTGASSGIGAGIAKKFAKDGYNVVINYYNENTKSDAEAVQKECEEYGAEAMIFQADVSDSEQSKALASAAFEKYGNVYALVNNAGITRDGLMMRMSEDQFESVINANLKSVFLMSKNVLPYMTKARRGRIINMASIAGIYGNAGQTNYSASKAGIIGLTKSLAREVGSRSITVNAIAPGFINTKMTAVLSDELKKDAADKIPLKRMGEPSDIAAAAAFLASEGAGYITGNVLCVDGGMTL